MRIGSLFAGMGGFDLAGEALGWRTVWVSEIDPFASAVLAQRFPHAPNLGDITLIDWTHVEPVDLLVGGFPCQPHSTAGRRAGSADERDLWPEFRRAIGVLRPRFVVGENVSALLTSERGRYFNRVVSDLASLGYAVEWDCLSASDVGAPHGRERLWIVAYSMGDAGGARGAARLSGSHARQARDAGVDDDRGDPRIRDWSDAVPFTGADGKVRLIPAGALAHDDSRRREFERLEIAPDEQRERGDESDRRAPSIRGDDARRSATERPWAQSSVCALADGIPAGLARRGLGAESGSLWPVSYAEPGRVAKLRAIGNAIVPLCALVGPFARIQQLENERLSMEKSA